MIQFSSGPRLLIAASAVALILTTIYGGTMLICRNSLRNCNYGNACPSGSVCVDYGDGVQKCSLEICANVRQAAKPVEQGVSQLMDGIASFFQEVAAGIH